MPRDNRWFRFYDRMIDSPQVIDLSDGEFRVIVSLWCIASRQDDKGRISYTETGLHKRCQMMVSAEEFQHMLRHLMDQDLLGKDAQGYFIPRWNNHQHDSFSATPSRRYHHKAGPGYVYLFKISSGQEVKIGYSKNLHVRLKQLRASFGAGDFLHTIRSENAHRLECELHTRYERYRTQGEWFNLSLEMIERLCSVMTEQELEEE